MMRPECGAIDVKQINSRDREFAAFLLSRSPLEAARAIAPGDEHPGLSAQDGEALLMELIQSIPRERASRPLSYLHSVLAGDASVVRQALADQHGYAARLDNRRLTNALLHVSLCLVVKVGAADTDKPPLTLRIADLSRAVRRSMRTLIERLKAYG
jgi:hypothetical protein